MEKDMVLTVLNEVLEELQKANKTLKTIQGSVGELEGRVTAFEQKEIRVEPPDLAPMNEAIDKLPALIAGETARMDGNIRKQVSVECGELRKETTAGVAQVAKVVQAWPQQGLFRTILWVFVIGVVYFLISQYIDRTHPYPTNRATTDSVVHMQTAAVPAPAQKPVETRERPRHKKNRKSSDTLDHAVIPRVFDTLSGK